MRSGRHRRRTPRQPSRASRAIPTDSTAWPRTTSATSSRRRPPCRPRPGRGREQRHAHLRPWRAGPPTARRSPSAAVSAGVPPARCSSPSTATRRRAMTLASGTASIALPGLTAGSHHISATFTSSVPPSGRHAGQRADRKPSRRPLDHHRARRGQGRCAPLPHLDDSSTASSTATPPRASPRRQP